MSDLIPFKFEGAAIRVVQFEGDPWFVGKDVAVPLGYANPSQALGDHCKSLKRLDSIKTIVSNDFNGLRGDTVLIPERDVYRLIMRSKLPAAERFEEWVVGEVLPMIRKTGSYGAEQAMAFFEKRFLGMIADAEAKIEQRLLDRIGIQAFANAESLRDSGYDINQSFITALQIRKNERWDVKHCPRPSAISSKLISWHKRHPAVARPRPGNPNSGLRWTFHVDSVDLWLSKEGRIWAFDYSEKKRGQTVFNFVKK